MTLKVMRIPRVADRDGKRLWVSGDDVLAPYATYGPGVTGSRRGRVLAEAGFASGKQTRPSEPAQRREDQERDGVEAEVIYGIIGISRGFFGSKGITDPDLLADVYRAYNQYIAVPEPNQIIRNTSGQKVALVTESFDLERGDEKGREEVLYARTSRQVGTVPVVCGLCRRG